MDTRYVVCVLSHHCNVFGLSNDAQNDKFLKGSVSAPQTTYRRYTRLSSQHPKVGHPIKLVVLAVVLRNVAVVKGHTIGRLSVEHAKRVEKWRATQHHLHFHLRNRYTASTTHV